MARVRGWEFPDAAVGSGYGVNPFRAAQSVDAVRVSGRLVPVTTWVHPEQLSRAGRRAGTGIGRVIPLRSVAWSSRSLWSRRWSFVW
jgi:hypothetical protein